MERAVCEEGEEEGVLLAQRGARTRLESEQTCRDEPLPCGGGGGTRVRPWTTVSSHGCEEKEVRGEGRARARPQTAECASSRVPVGTAAVPIPLLGALFRRRRSEGCGGASGEASRSLPRRGGAL